MDSSTSEDEKSRYKQPPSRSSEIPSVDDSEFSFGQRKRKATVYDAVAGTITQSGFIGNTKHARPSRKPLRPDEVLFKSTKAPIRFEEDDYYFAHKELPADQSLPSGDLLTAIHAYISKLYLRTEDPDASSTWICMDETALIALGVLIEETARGVLGKTGDLAFTEADDEAEEDLLASEDGEDGEVEADEMEIDDEDQEQTAERSMSGDERTENESAESESASDDGSRSSSEVSEVQ